jgi:hypothetical protein
MARSAAARLSGYERRYRALAAELATIGYIRAGSITRRRTRCANPNCRCRADPPQMHGPYWQWTAKQDGKTITRRLTPAQAELYRQWIDNDRQLRHVIQQMRQIAAEATQTILDAATDEDSKV